MLPLKTQDNHGDVDGMYYNGNAPSRSNPRIPIKRVNLHGDEVHEDANLEYDTTEGDDQDEGAAREDDNSSLWIDPRKTPMDRIQVHYHSLDLPYLGTHIILYYLIYNQNHSRMLYDFFCLETNFGTTRNLFFDTYDYFCCYQLLIQLAL